MFKGIDLPDAYTVHFSNDERDGEAVTQMGDADGAEIPATLLQTGKNVFAWVYLHTGDDDGETVYRARIPVMKRPRPLNEPPTPVQQSAIDQAIVALNNAVEKAEGAAAHALDAEAWAVGKRDGADVEPGDATYRNNSAWYAYLAEQAAATAGYMDMMINEDGDLIYSRTDSVDVDFEIVDGYLVMGVIN